MVSRSNNGDGYARRVEIFNQMHAMAQKIYAEAAGRMIDLDATPDDLAHTAVDAMSAAKIFFEANDIATFVDEDNER